MLNEVDLLRSTIAASAIKRVAIVDDVFDTPTIGYDNLGKLLDFLQNNKETRAHANIEQGIWDDAITDIGESEFDSGNVSAVIEKLYEMYIYTGDKQFDPTDVFERTRDANLNFLRPILELLKSCECLDIRTFGSAAMTTNEGEMPDLVLVDLYLNPALSPISDPNLEDAQAAVDKSIERVRPLLKNEPAIILMSSHGTKGRKEADNYRARLNDRIYASRFSFVDKGHVIKDPKLGLKVDGVARETLLDVFQTYKFGKALSEAMTRWLTAAKDAVDVMGKDVRSLQLKEIAYLIQFRLAAEGLGLEEYLEWFFGEALLDYIIRATDHVHTGNSIELSLDSSAVMGIDGGFEPTKDVARMYHRVRVESARTRVRKNFRLGDLYLDKSKRRVVAVMTPDCDLVLRTKSNGKGVARNSEHLLLVPGVITDLEKISASVGDFLMIGESPHNIQWLYKKVFSAPFTGTFEKAGQSGEDYEYLGALRPLYAQEIQANLLNHIGRVGVAVSPVIGFPAVATIVVRTTTSTPPIKEISAQGTTFSCSLVPSRASDQQSRVVFDRDVIRKITNALIEMPIEDLIAGSAEKVEALKKTQGVSIANALKLGPTIGEVLSDGIILTSGTRKFDSTAPWCAIYVSQVVPKHASQQITENPESEQVLVPETTVVGLVEVEAEIMNHSQGFFNPIQSLPSASD